MKPILATGKSVRRAHFVDAPSLNVPPERLPRRALLGMGADSPHLLCLRLEEIRAGDVLRFSDVRDTSLPQSKLLSKRLRALT